MILGLITARGGSKGVPGKNVKLLGGKPLVAWTIKAALESGVIDRLIVSTDDEKIAEVCREWGAEVPFMRPAEIAQDKSTSLEVLNHALDWWERHEAGQPDAVLLLQPTSPFRSAGDIIAASELYSSEDADAVVSVCEAPKHPWLMRRINSHGQLEPFMDTKGRSTRRQDLPPVYAVNGAIYLNSVLSLKRDRTFIPPRTKPHIMPALRSIDIDEMLDFHIAEALVSGNHVS